jgi:hypothetical protein
MLPDPWHVDEFQVNDLDVLIFDLLQDVLGGFSHELTPCVSTYLKNLGRKEIQL